MKRHSKRRNWPVYTVLTVLNGCLFIALGAVVAPPSYAEPPVASSAVRLSDAPKLPPDKPSVGVAKTGVPTHLTVPSVEIDLEVKVGAYQPEDKTWTLDDTSAFYANRTVPANTNNGTTLIYGHGTWAVFGRIPDISEGAEAYISTSNGLTFVYGYQSSRQVMPDDTTVLDSGGPPSLVLLTCSGQFDTYRTLVSFRLLRVVGYE